MNIRIIDKVSWSDFKSYSQIDPSFEIRSYYEIPDSKQLDFSGYREVETDPHTKNYDQIPGNSMEDWFNLFGLEQVIFFILEENGLRIGSSIAIAREDNIDLWDLRIRKEKRGKGTGKEFVIKIVSLLRKMNFSKIYIETQNNNVRACKMYSSLGFRIISVQRNAYSEPDLRNEIRIDWELVL